MLVDSERVIFILIDDFLNLLNLGNDALILDFNLLESFLYLEHPLIQIFFDFLVSLRLYLSQQRLDLAQDSVKLRFLGCALLFEGVIQSCDLDEVLSQ